MIRITVQHLLSCPYPEQDAVAHLKENANFFSVLFDGATDSSAKDREAIILQYFCRKTMTFHSKFLSIPVVVHGHATGIKDAITKALNEAGVHLLFHKGA